MADRGEVRADPSAVGGVAKAPFVMMPDPARVFARRAARFDGLAATSPLEPYLTFLGRLSSLQADLGADPAPIAPVPAAAVDLAREHAMPPLDRMALADHPEVIPTLHRLFDEARAIPQPGAAAAALDSVRGASAGALAALAANVLADAVPVEALAEHLYVAAGLQVLGVRLAATLEAGALQPVGTGVCPACGGPPVASLVVGTPGAEGARYAVCSLCATLWNEVRVKCLACGATKGIGYREVETDGEAATLKAEVCDTCGAYVKILYQNKNPSLDAVADDVASLGLDVLVREAGYRRAGFNAYLLGY